MNKVKSVICSVIIIFISIYCFKTITKVTDVQENSYSATFFEIIEGKDNMGIVHGRGNSGEEILIDLGYMKQDIVLKDAYFINFTGDDKEVLCLELNIWNSISSDFNTIVIYDTEDEKVLFPTTDKSFIYNGYIDQIELADTTKKVIRYSSYKKINGISIEDECSTIIWNDDSFETLEYQSKLLLENEEYIVFYEASLVHEDTAFKLLILGADTLEIIQEIELKIDEVSITKKIAEHELVMQVNDELYDLYVDGYGILVWQPLLKEFK